MLVPSLSLWRSFRSTLFVWVTFSFLLGCGGAPPATNNNNNNANSNSNTDKVQEKRGVVRFIHVSYDAPGVDILVDGSPAFSGVEYGGTLGYAEVPLGKRVFTAVQAGTKSPELLKREEEITAKTRATIVAFDQASKLKSLLLSAPEKVNPEKAQIRFVHTVPDAPAVDIKAGDASSKSLFAGVAFGKSTSFLEVDENSYEVVVTPAGKEDVVVAFEAVKLEKGKTYTIVARGTLNANDEYAFGVRVYIDNGEGKAFLDLTPKATKPPVGKDAFVRVIHGVASAGGVDLNVDGSTVGTNLTYRLSTGYLKVGAGERSVKVTPTGQSAPVLIDAMLKVDAEQSYTVLALPDGTAIKAATTKDERAPNSGKAKIRLFHGSPDAPAVDIKVNDPAGPAAIANVSFGSASPYIEVDSGAYSFVVTGAGDTKAVVSFESVGLDAGKVYTAIAFGTLDASDSFDFTVRVFIDNGDGKSYVDLKPKVTKPSTGKAQVRVIHGSYNAPAVDIAVDGKKAITGLTYRLSSGYAEVEEGSRNIEVLAASNGQSLLSRNITLQKETSYTVFAMNSAQSFEVVATDDKREPVADKAKIRLVHASPDAPSVDVKLSSATGPMLFANNSFKAVTPYREVDAKSYSLVITAAGQTKAVVSFEPVALEKGKVYSAVAFGTLDPNDKYPFGVRVFVDNGDGKTFVDLKLKTVTPPSEKSNVRVLHMSYDAPNVDVRVDGSVAVKNLAFKLSSGYASLPAGRRKVQVTPAGKSTPVVIEANLELKKGTDYTVLAVDQLSKIGPLVAVDNRAANSSKAKVRFVHASPDAPAVDIRVNSGTGPTVFAKAAFKTVTKYIEVDEGSYSFVVTPAGQTNVVIAFEAVKLEKGNVYTVVAHGTLSAADKYPFGVRAFVDNGAGTAFVDLKPKAAPPKLNAKVRVLHMSYNAPNVDVAVDGKVAIKNLGFKASSGYATLGAGSRKVAVTPAGKTTPVVIAATLNLAKDTDYTVLAVDQLSKIGPLVSVDARTPVATQARVRFVHASPDAPPVDIRIGSGTGARVFSNAKFKTITSYVNVNEGSYSFVVTPAGQTNVVIAFEAVKLEKGKVYTVVAHGTLNATDKYPFGVRAFVDNGAGTAFVDLKPKAAPPKLKANVRVFHMSYNAPNVDVAVDGTVAIKNLAFKASSGYASLDAGSRKVTVTPAGKTTPVVINATLPLTANRDYSVFAVNRLSTIQPLFIQDNRAPISTQAKVRFVHAAPDAPAVDIRIGSGAGPRVFSNRSFRQISGYVAVNEGSYSFVVTPAGKTSVVVAFEAVKLEKGKVYTVVAHGTLNATDKYPFGVRAFVDNGAGSAFIDLKPKVAPPVAKAKVRVIHMSYDAPNVDVAVDGTVAIKNLAFKASSGYATLNAGSRKVAVTPAGKTTPVVIAATLNLAKDTDYTVFAADQLSKIGPLVVADARTPSTTQAKVRFVHASPDAPAVDIRIGSGTGARVFSNRSFRQISGYVAVNEGSYSFVVTPAGKTSVVVAFEAVKLEKGKVYTVVAHGTLNATDKYPFGVRAFVDNDPGSAFIDLKPKVAPPVSKAKVRVIHMSYDAPNVDVAVDGTVAIKNLAFKASSGYATLNAGSRKVAVTPAGKTTPVVIAATLNLAKDKDYTVFAADQLSKIGPLVVEDARTPDAGKAKVRFVHASPDAPAVDIRVGTAIGPRVFANRAFKSISSYVTVDEGSYSFVVTPADKNTEVISFLPVKLEKGKVYTVVAHGTLNATDKYPFGVRAFVDNDPGSAFVDLQVRATSNVLFVNAFPDRFQSVDFYINGQRIRSNIRYTANTGYLKTTAGRVTLEVRRVNSRTALSRITLTTVANDNYSVFFTGSGTFRRTYRFFAAKDDLKAPPSGQAKVRFAHSSSDAGSVDIWVRGGPRLFRNAAYLTTTAFVNVAAKSYNLDVRRTNSTSVLLRVSNVSLQAGKIYTIFARGRRSSLFTPLGATVIVNK